MRDALGDRELTPGAAERASHAFERILAQSGGRIFDTWSGNTRHYADALAGLLTDPGDPARILQATVPSLLTRPRPGYLQRNGESVWVEKLKDGDPALFWNGGTIEARRFDARQNEIAEFLTLAEKVAGYIERRGNGPMVVIDVGAGFGAFSLYLHERLGDAARSKCRIVNVERDVVALVVAELLLDQLGARSTVANIAADMNLAVNGDESLWQALRTATADLPDDRGVVIVTRGALHPYFSDDQYRKMFGMLMQRLRPRAGFHFELVGHRAPEFAQISARLPQKSPVAEVYLSNPSDPFAVLKALAGEFGIAIVEYAGAPPQFFHDRLLSYLSWQRQA